MKNTVELDDKRYVIQEVKPDDPTEENNFLEVGIVVGRVIGKLIYKVFQFGLYLSVTFLELLIKLLKTLFLGDDYKPFNFILEAREKRLDRRAKDNINKEKIRFVSDYLCRHEYVFPRTDTFLNDYKQIQQRLKDISENNINLSNELYHDTMKRISILVTEAEKQALKLGYEYARETKYQLDTSTVYQDFIQDKVMQGESNRKFTEDED